MRTVARSRDGLTTTLDSSVHPIGGTVSQGSVKMRLPSPAPRV